MYIEKRKENRVCLSLPAQFKVFDLGRLPEEVKEGRLEGKAQIQDVSLGGLQVLSAVQLKEGDVMELEMEIPGKGKMRSVAKVAWSREVPPGGSWQCGIHFIPVYEADLEVLNVFFGVGSPEV
jgi:hypothetical protein